MITSLLTSVASRAVWLAIGAGALATVYLTGRADIQRAAVAEQQQAVMRAAMATQEAALERLQAERARADEAARQAGIATRRLGQMQRERATRAEREAIGDAGCEAMLRAVCPALADGLRRPRAGGDGDTGGDGVPAGGGHPGQARDSGAGRR